MISASIALFHSDEFSSAVTQHGVRLALAERDAESLRREDTAPVHEDILPSTLIVTGLEYEAQQFVICLVYSLAC